MALFLVQTSPRAPSAGNPQWGEGWGIPAGNKKYLHSLPSPEGRLLRLICIVRSDEQSFRRAKWEKGKVGRLTACAAELQVSVLPQLEEFIQMLK